jgi:hypothetical protein
MLEEPDRQILDAIIQARDRVVEMEARLPATRLEHDQDFLQESLKSKMQVLLGSLDELPSLEVGAFSVGEALRGAVRDGNTEPQQVSLTMPASALVAREIASLQVRQNLLEPRHRAMLMVVERLRSEYDSLQVVASERDSKMRRILARKDIIDKSYARFLANYQATRKGADDLGLSITTLAPRVADYGAAFDGLRIETASLRADLADLELRRSRLARQVDIYQSTFSKFQKLAEDARIAKAE